MSFSDPIGDMLTRIRNAQMRRKTSVTTPASTLRGRVLDVLQSEGFIRGYSEVKFENGSVSVAPRFETKRARSLYGTARAQVANLVEGVTKGFEKKLEITGVGYRAALQGKTLQLALGYSHDVNYPVPEGISITVPKPTEIVVAGNNAQQVGQVAAEIRAFRKPEPYKGKGVKYADEFIFRKEGKKK